MSDNDEQWMQRTIEVAAVHVGLTSPNPCVGAILRVGAMSIAGVTGIGGSPHAEAAAIATARQENVDLRGATLFVTLEPCAHVGRNPACVDAIIDAGISRVVVGVEDPDSRVSGSGVAALRRAGVEVVTGVASSQIAKQLRPYIQQRTTGRPYVILKMAMTMDGRIAAPDGTSQWITGAEARKDVHELRRRCDAVIVGAETVRVDNPLLTVRLDDGVDVREPLRVVLGDISQDARVQPALAWPGSMEDLLDELGRRGCLQVLVEGGAAVAGSFHRAGLVDRYVIYVAPAFLGGDDGRPIYAGIGAETMGDVWRGNLTDVTRFGDDVRMIVEAVS